LRKAALLAAVFLSLVSPVLPQVEKAMLKVRVVLVDGNLNQKPVPRLLLKVERVDTPGAEAVAARTGFDGTAEIALAPGRYRVATPEGIEFRDRHYEWSEEITVQSPENGPGSALELSNDNAAATSVRIAPKAANSAEFGALFAKYQNSVVTVWSESGHGSGFVADDELGLILTNQHVVGTSEYMAVQFDEKRKVAAKVVAFDAERDVAVLWANLDAFPEAIAAPLAKTAGRAAAVAEGDRVFTIGSPLSQRKILTTGVVSKVEPRAILSDIRINPGNSGGPLFTLAGTVVGLTTFLERDREGAGDGIAGAVRIEEAELLLDRARTKLRGMTPPDARLLPVEPAGAYPVNAIKSSLEESRKFDESPYIFHQGPYDVAIVTPVLKYRLAEGARLREREEKEKRTTRTTRAIKGTFRPLDDLKSWTEYTGEYKPVIQIEASPQLGRDMGLKLDVKKFRKNPKAMRMKFKADFYSMKLFCGAQEIEPIHPGRVSTEIDYHTAEYEIADSTFMGLYSYPYDAISSNCSEVTLQLFSEKEPDKPVIKVLDAKTVARVAADFDPFRQAKGDSSTVAGAAK
jgi:S1-C subfamily serine protease